MCKNEGIKQSHLDFLVKGDAASVRMECKTCGWKSGRVKEEHTKGLLNRLNSKLPNVYWHEFPPSKELRSLFVEARSGGEGDKKAVAETPPYGK